MAKRIGGIVHQDWSLAHGEEWLVPDVMLTQPGGYQTDQRGYLTSTPLLCIEILSPGQTRSELLHKCRFYHLWGVPHCWVIDPAARVCFESHAPDVFKLIGADEELTAGDGEVSGDWYFRRVTGVDSKPHWEFMQVNLAVLQAPWRVAI